MDAKALAERSLDFGVGLWAFLIINFLIDRMVTALDQSSVPGLWYADIFLLLLLVNVILNLGGVTIGVVALFRNRKNGKDHRLVRKAILGILLNITSVVAMPFLLVALLFG